MRLDYYKVGDIVQLSPEAVKILLNKEAGASLFRLKPYQPYRVRRVVTSVNGFFDLPPRYDLLGNIPATYYGHVPSEFLVLSRHVFGIGDRVRFKLRPIYPFVIGVIKLYDFKSKRYLVDYEGTLYPISARRLTLKY